MLVVLMVVSLLTPIFTSTAQAQLANPTTPTTPANPTSSLASNDGSSPVTCAVQKIGWFLCPIIEMSAKFSDAAFGMLATTFLQTEPELIATSTTGSTPSGTMQAWSQARNIANILFIIAFLIIIISQLTGYGISNYGIKKMIPRLVIAAIAVNVSYYICQTMVDLSNILGFGLEDMLNKAAISVTQQSAMPLPSGGRTAGNALGAMAIVVLASAAAVILIPLCLTSILLVLFTCIAIVFILLMRKAIIVLLVVASPLAFVAYLLPNTEKWFSKWLKMFTQLLMVFPTIGLLIGGGQLASRIILVAGAGQDQYQICATGDPSCQNQCVTTSTPTGIQGQSTATATGSCATGSASVKLGLIAAGVAVAPLIATYSVLQGALSAAGAIGGKIQGAIKNTADRAGKFTAKYTTDPLQNAARSRVQNEASAWWRNTQSRGIDPEHPERSSFLGRRAAQRAAREKRYSLAKSDLERNQGEAVTSMLTSDKAAAIVGDLSAQGQALAIANATAHRRKEQDEAVADARANLARRNPSAEELRNEARALVADHDFDSPHLAALLEQLEKTEKAEFMRLGQQISNSGGGHETVASRTIADGLGRMSGMFGEGNIGRVRSGGSVNLASEAARRAREGDLSAKNVADWSTDDIAYMDDVTTGDTTARANITSKVAEAEGNDQLRGGLNDRKRGMFGGF